MISDHDSQKMRRLALLLLLPCYYSQGKTKCNSITCQICNPTHLDISALTETDDAYILDVDLGLLIE